MDNYSSNAKGMYSILSTLRSGCTAFAHSLKRVGLRDLTVDSMAAQH